MEQTFNCRIVNNFGKIVNNFGWIYFQLFKSYVIFDYIYI